MYINCVFNCVYKLNKYFIYIKKLHFWYCPLTSGPPCLNKIQFEEVTCYSSCIHLSEFNKCY